MEYDYYYADMQVNLQLKADNENYFGKLTDNEYLALQQVLYLALHTFQITAALHIMDDVKKGGD